MDSVNFRQISGILKGASLNGRKKPILSRFWVHKRNGDVCVCEEARRGESGSGQVF